MFMKVCCNAHIVSLSKKLKTKQILTVIAQYRNGCERDFTMEFKCIKINILRALILNYCRLQYVK